MIRKLLPSSVALLALATAPVGAAEIELDLGDIGPRWLGPNYQDNLGWNAQSIGDLNGDGNADFAVSAPQDDGPPSFPSVLRIYLGGSELPEEGHADWAGADIIDGKAVGDAIYNYRLIPDGTGDGAPDILIAEPKALGGLGKALLLEGGGALSGVLGAAEAVHRWNGYLQDEFPDDLSPETAPSDVAGGDLDGDGLSDVVIVSAKFQRVWVDYSADGFEDVTVLSEVPWYFTSCTDEFPSALVGSGLAVGDLTGDGRAELVISAPGCNSGAGRVWLWYGGNGPLPAEPDLVIDGGDRLGGRLHIGDLNGDGIGDLFIQEQRSGETDFLRGNLHVHFGAAGGLQTTPDFSILGGFSDLRFGETVAILPDVTGDGLPELVVGSPEAAYNGRGYGAVYIFEGREDWTGEIQVNEAKYLVTGSHLGSTFGASLAVVDDFDGDGHPEIVIGEPNYTDGSAEEDFERGRFYLFTALPDRDDDGDGTSTLNGDCDDNDASIRPGLLEECDGIDNNCNHAIDEGCGDDDDDDSVDDDDDDSGGPVWFGDDDDDDCNCENSLIATADGPRSPTFLLLPLAVALAGRRRRP
jgi:hypothetical protein